MCQAAEKAETFYGGFRFFQTPWYPEAQAEAIKGVARAWMYQLAMGL
jgi:hypothetical protein